MLNKYNLYAYIAAVRELRSETHGSLLSLSSAQPFFIDIAGNFVVRLEMIAKKVKPTLTDGKERERTLRLLAFDC